VLEKLGRYGDTKLRVVDGELSHVNEIEANLIDDYGPLGAVITKEIGSGTINPNTGLKEYYFWPMVGSAVLSGVGQYISANSDDADASNLERNMQPYQNSVNQLGDAANARINPDSSYNMLEDKRLEQSAYDSMGVANLLSNRGSSQGGMGGYSGINSQWAQADMSRRNAELQAQIAQSRVGRQTQGYNMLTQVAGMQGDLGTLKMQRDLSKPRFDAGSLLSNIGTGLTDNFMNKYMQGGGGVTNAIQSTLNSIDTSGLSFPSFGETINDNAFSVNNMGSSYGYQPNINFQ
tara:strand:- start:12750 stop:13622 length:873 start_codon:yes stop_codon:yes gene_type:complete